MSIELERPADAHEVQRAIAAWRGAEEAAGLPSAPERALLVSEEPDHPQPRRQVDTGRGHDGRRGSRSVRPGVSRQARRDGTQRHPWCRGSLDPQRRADVSPGPAGPVIVLKFGGTSVGDAEAIARTGRIVAARGLTGGRSRMSCRRLAGVTNALIAIAEQAAKRTPHRRAPRRRGSCASDTGAQAEALPGPARRARRRARKSSAMDR